MARRTDVCNNLFYGCTMAENNQIGVLKHNTIILNLFFLVAFTHLFHIESPPPINDGPFWLAPPLSEWEERKKRQKQANRVIESPYMRGSFFIFTVQHDNIM